MGSFLFNKSKNRFGVQKVSKRELAKQVVNDVLSTQSPSKTVPPKHKTHDDSEPPLFPHISSGLNQKTSKDSATSTSSTTSAKKPAEAKEISQQSPLMRTGSTNSNDSRADQKITNKRNHQTRWNRSTIVIPDPKKIAEAKEKFVQAALDEPNRINSTQLQVIATEDDNVAATDSWFTSNNQHEIATATVTTATEKMEVDTEIANDLQSHQTTAITFTKENMWGIEEVDEEIDLTTTLLYQWKKSKSRIVTQQQSSLSEDCSEEPKATVPPLKANNEVNESLKNELSNDENSVEIILQVLDQIISNVEQEKINFETTETSPTIVTCHLSEKMEMEVQETTMTISSSSSDGSSSIEIIEAVDNDQMTFGSHALLPDTMTMIEDFDLFTNH
jgi:hypothetical protein